MAKFWDYLVKIAQKFGITYVVLKIHLFWLKFGIQVLPNHYYSSVADIASLKRNKETWAKKSDLPGVSSDLDEQVENLKKICSPYQNEYKGGANYLHGVEKHFGQGYGFIESQALHAVIRHYKPKRIVEVGSGVSTYCTLKAIEKNGFGEMICIEPYPSDQLQMLPNIKLVKQEAQRISFETFTSLDNNDLLFIDSSHTVKPGSDVNYIILEILPRLKKGVIVHFHDIYLPYDYQIDILNTFNQWSETSLLRAFLINNSKAKIIFCLSQLHYDRKSVLSAVFPDYKPMDLEDGLVKGRLLKYSGDFPSSIYIQIN